MRLSDLNKIDIKDLKNLNYDRILRDIKNRPDLLISAVVILITLFVSVNAYSTKKGEIKLLRTELKNLDEKVKAINEYNAVKAKLTEFVDNIPDRIYQDEVINLITDIAVKWRVQIKSFTPARIYSEPLYESMPFRLSVVAEEYVDIWLFINDIEKLPFALRIDSWDASLNARSVIRNRRANNEVSNESIKATLEISAINFKS